MNLARHLVDRGDDVLSISRSPMRSAPFTYGLRGNERFSYEQCHIHNTSETMWLLEQFEPEQIVNFAALCEVALSWDHALDYYETNLMSLVRLTNELYKARWLKRFIQIGSSEVYGSVVRPVDENAGINPSSPYAVSKAVFDFHLRAIARHKGFPAVIALPSNGYCEGQTLNRIIPKTIIAALTGTKLQLQGGGVARKSYLHADDISDGIMLLMEKGGLGETYNIGPDNSFSIREIVEFTANICGKTLDDVAEIAPERLGQDAQYLLDSTKIKLLGWRQKIFITEGLTRMVDWVKKYPELLTMDQTYTHRA